MLSKEVRELAERVVKEAYEEARSNVPQFTDQLFLWAHQNKTTDALSRFLAAFVDKAIIASIDLITKNLKMSVVDEPDDKGEAR